MKVALIDASGYLYRAYHAIEDKVTRSDGVQVHAIKGYCEMLRSILKRSTHTHIVVVLDGGRSGRDKIDPNYKANRPPRPAELVAQLEMLPEASAAFGVATVKMPGFEADDVIASYAHRIANEGGEAQVFSIDKDLISLLAIPGVTIFDPFKNQDVTDEVAFERYGVWPHQMTCWLSMLGDASDNIPGVKGVGEKTAAALLATHGDLDAILLLAEGAPESLRATPRIARLLKDGADKARLSRDLVVLQRVTGLPAIDTLAYAGHDTEALCSWLQRMEFNRMAHEMRQAVAA